MKGKLTLSTKMISVKDHSTDTTYHLKAINVKKWTITSVIIIYIILTNVIKAWFVC